jgi:hypothetical protein
MRVDERKATRAVMIGGRDVSPGSRRYVVQKIPLIYGIRMFVERQPGFSGFQYRGSFQVLKILRKEELKPLRVGSFPGPYRPKCELIRRQFLLDKSFQVPSVRSPV